MSVPYQKRKIREKAIVREYYRSLSKRKHNYQKSPLNRGDFYFLNIFIYSQYNYFAIITRI